MLIKWISSVASNAARTGSCAGLPSEASSSSTWLARALSNGIATVTNEWDIAASSPSEVGGFGRRRFAPRARGNVLAVELDDQMRGKRPQGLKPAGFAFGAAKPVSPEKDLE